MLRAARAAGPIIQVARLGARHGQQFAQIARRNGRMHHQNRSNGRDHGNRHQITRGIIGKAQERRVDRQRSGRAHQQRIAIRRAAHHRFSTNGTARTGAVFDHHRLPECWCQFLGHIARQHIGGTTRRKGRDQPKAARGPGFLGGSKGGKGKKPGKGSASCCHGMIPVWPCGHAGGVSGWSSKAWHQTP